MRPPASFPETSSHREEKGQPSPPSEAPDFTVIRILHELYQELHPSHSPPQPFTLESSLDNALGFDSLSRAELVQRLEFTFNTRLPEELMVQAQTGRDLVIALSQTSPSPPPTAHEVRTANFNRGEIERIGTTKTVGFSPHTTLNEALYWHGEHQPDTGHILVYEGNDQGYEITYGELVNQATRVANGLTELGIKPGDRVALMLPTGRDYFAAFSGILVAGAIPMPIYPPVRSNQLQEHLLRHQQILNNAEAKILITVSAAMALSRLVQNYVPSLRHIITATALQTHTSALYTYHPAPDDVALLQYTSGSTGNPKGVALSHANLMANIHAMGRAIDIEPSDTFVSWLPLYHDMGLIGAWLGMLVYGVPLVSLSPIAFLRRPDRWLRCISEHQATLSAAPNFAYELCHQKINDESLDGVDLSPWRLAFNGAEPVSPRTTKTFCQRFSTYGFRATSMAPVYGLAECGLGLTFPPLKRGVCVDRVSPTVFAQSARAEPTTADHALEFVSCGSVLPDYQLRIVNDEGLAVAEREEGHIQFQGPSATRGYWENVDANHELFVGDWLDTGDRGYLANNELYITCREKDMIIRAGRNLFPYDLEAAVGEIDAIRKGCVAVFGSTDKLTGTERIVVVAERRGQGSQDDSAICREIQKQAQRIFGTPVDDIALVAPFSVLKTSSGKIRRTACRERYELGEIETKPTPLWWQIGKLAGRGIPGLSLRLIQHTSQFFYATYVWLLFGVLGLISIPWSALLPRFSSRWRCARFAARLFIALSGITLEVKGDRHWSGEPALFIANHASYMDWLVLLATLPAPFSFVAKAELQRTPWIGWLLRRLGTEFVERTHARKSVLDMEHLAEVGKSGRHLLIFPEGTFQSTAGIIPFRMGAFSIAVKANLPIIPIGINGTRRILRDGSWLAQRDKIILTFASPITIPPNESAQNDWQTAIGLRERAHAIIVALSGETALHYRPHSSRSRKHP